MFVASLGDTVIAKSEDCLVIENNIYFPENDVKTEYLLQTETLTRCPWKGMATYFDIKTISLVPELINSIHPVKLKKAEEGVVFGEL